MENSIVNILNFVVNNWSLLIALVCGIILAITKIIEFIALPTQKKISEVKRRLLSWVTNAEVDLGGGTGEIKLAEVYDTFCAEYPHLKKWISLEKFQDMVDESLEKMREILDKDNVEL